MSTSNSVFQKISMQLMLIALLCVVSTVLFSLIAGGVVSSFYGVNLNSLNNYSDPNVIEGLKLFQLLSAIGLFIVPPFVFGIIVNRKPFKYLTLNKSSTLTNCALVFVLMIAAAPFMSWLVDFNNKLVLPEFLTELENWMKQSEKSAEELTKLFLTFNGLGSLLYILFIVAIIPAIGEELLFRGVLQKILISWAKNYHLGIWITAILFSALHVQFYGFIPRMFLGAVFGYVFYWSGSIWLPILGHFINNGSVVLLSYLYPAMMKKTEINFFEGATNWIVTIASATVVFLLLLFFKKIQKMVKE